MCLRPRLFWRLWHDRPQRHQSESRRRRTAQVHPRRDGRLLRYGTIAAYQESHLHAGVDGRQAEARRNARRGRTQPAASSRLSGWSPTRTRSTTWRPAAPRISSFCSTPPRRRARTASWSNTSCATCWTSRRAAVGHGKERDTETEHRLSGRRPRQIRWHNTKPQCFVAGDAMRSRRSKIDTGHSERSAAPVTAHPRAATVAQPAPMTQRSGGDAQRAYEVVAQHFAPSSRLAHALKDELGPAVSGRSRGRYRRRPDGSAIRPAHASEQPVRPTRASNGHGTTTATPSLQSELAAGDGVELRLPTDKLPETQSLFLSPPNSRSRFAGKVASKWVLNGRSIWTATVAYSR